MTMPQAFILLVCCLLLVQGTEAQGKSDVSRATVSSNSKCPHSPLAPQCCSTVKPCVISYGYKASWNDRLDSEDPDICKDRCDCHNAECLLKCNSLSKVRASATSGSCKCVYQGPPALVSVPCTQKCNAAKTACYNNCDNSPKMARTNVSFLHNCGGTCNYRKCPKFKAGSLAVTQARCPAN